MSFDVQRSLLDWTRVRERERTAERCRREDCELSHAMDEEQIRTLIEQWAAAVHRGDMNGVVADHSDDIVMFDVPPPNEVRGIEAYRETWPPFFEWQKRGAAFATLHSMVEPIVRPTFGPRVGHGILSFSDNTGAHGRTSPAFLCPA
jgi:SnoaL-like domain